MFRLIFSVFILHRRINQRIKLLREGKMRNENWKMTKEKNTDY